MIDYFKYQFLKIDFIDESVDLLAEDPNQASEEIIDYVGSVRIPLKELLLKD